MILEEIKELQIKLRKDKEPSTLRKNKFLAGILTTLIGEISIVGKNDGNRETTDIEAEKVITKFLKGAKEIDKLLQDKVKKTGENLGDKLLQISSEIELYESFLPKQLSEDDLRINIQNYICLNDFTSIKDMGAIMNMLKRFLPGQYDGKMASRIIKESF
jgi:hypothetical protein